MYRLLVVAFATGALIIRQTIDWTGVEEGVVGYQGIRMLCL